LCGRETVLTREHWDVGGFFQFDYINTYDKHGRIIKRETSNGYYAMIEFSPQGNHLRDVVYFGDEVLASDDYTYNQPNKNPFTAIPGLPYAFLMPIRTKVIGMPQAINIQCMKTAIL
jgi:hypothetical protein